MNVERANQAGRCQTMTDRLGRAIATLFWTASEDCFYLSSRSKTASAISRVPTFFPSPAKMSAVR